MAASIRRIVMVFLAIVLMINVYGVMPCAYASLIGTKAEIDMGRDASKQLEKQFGLVDDFALQARVTKIGMSLVAVCDRKDLPYTFRVLNSPEVNALALPGGFIYIFKGLVDLMPSDEELAGVIGHEIGHVVKRHTVQQIEKNLLLNIASLAIFRDKGLIEQSLAINAIMAGYSRDDEREADRLGYLHSYKAGYNPYSMIMGLKKLSSLDQHYQYDLFSDHPESKERIALVQKYVEEAKIHPKVKLSPDGKGALVVDGTWQLPIIDRDSDDYKLIYRAYFTAGALYCVSQLPDYNSDKFILDSDGSNVIIYYDDHKIIALTPQDAEAHKMSQMDLAGEYVDKLREWKP